MLSQWRQKGIPKLGALVGDLTSALQEGVLAGAYDISFADFPAIH